jgi:hypothetical protein
MNEIARTLQHHHQLGVVQQNRQRAKSEYNDAPFKFLTKRQARHIAQIYCLPLALFHCTVGFVNYALVGTRRRTIPGMPHKMHDIFTVRLGDHALD